MNQAEPVIQVESLTKRFGPKTVVDDFSLTVNQGEIYGFLGPNGSGKTTTIRMLCGLLRPDGGRGTCLGLDIISQSDGIKTQAGYMAQHFSLYEDLTVKENLIFMAQLFSVPRRKQAVKDAIANLELAPFTDQMAGTLSGGWKQRLALACCLIHRPKLLLLDEPTAGVDPKARRDFWDRVHELSSQGITTLISTHYMDEAERCHRLAYIAYGHLLAKGSPEELVEAEGLTTWAVSGGDLPALGRQLRELAGIEQVAAFGNNLHVSGRNPWLLARAIEPYRHEPYKWREVKTKLEEVFISLMSKHEVQ